MTTRRSLLLAAAALPFIRPAHAQGWAPEKTVRVIIPVAPGGSLDILGRSLARGLGSRLGQPTVAENHAGAGSNIAFELTARARPDGHTLLVASDPLTINPALYPQVGFDPVRDFAAVAEAVRSPQVLVVNPASPAQDLKGFLDLARQSARAGRPLSMASQGNGSIGHLAGSLLAEQAGAAWQHIPYRGGGPAVVDLVAGHTDALLVTLPAAIEQIRAGRLRALAMTSAARSPALPAVPTVAESGFPGFEVVTWQGLVTTAGSPPAAVARLAEETLRVLADPAATAQLTELGFEVTGTGPEAFAHHIRTEAERWPTLVRRLRVSLT